MRRRGEEVAGSLDVQIVHLARVGRVAAYQAGQMIEPLDTGKGAADRVGVADVALDHLRVREWQAGAYEHADVMSFLAQHRHQRGPEESGGAGHQQLHREASSRRPGRPISGGGLPSRSASIESRTSRVTSLCAADRARPWVAPRSSS